MGKYAAGIEIWNAVLVSQGQETVQVNDGSPEYALYLARFDGMVRSRLSSHQTGFARKTSLLVYQGTTGNRPVYAYALPADVLKVHRVFNDLAITTDYEIRGNKLVSDIRSDALTIDYTWNVPIKYWSDDFTEAVVTECQAILYRFYERTLDAERTEQKAEELFRDARARDRMAQKLPDITPEPRLVGAWRRSKTTTR